MVGSPKRQLLLTVLGVVSRPRLTLALAAILLIASGAFAFKHLTISSDTNKLFDPRVAFFRDYLHFVETFPENEAIFVVVRPAKDGLLPPVARWTAIADAIAAQLAKRPDVVRSVDARVPIDKLGAQGMLFDEADRIRSSVNDARSFVPLVKVIAEHDALRSLFLGGTPLERLLASLDRAPLDRETSGFVAMLANSWNHTVTHADVLRPGAGLPDLAAQDADDPSRLGYYYVPDELDRAKPLLLVRVFAKQGFDSLAAVSDGVDKIDAVVREAARPYPEFTVGLTGRPALDANEMRTTDRDSHRAEACALVAVFVGLVVAMRSIWLAIAGEIALGVGIGWTFGWATISVGELNLLSIVFLLALIGIGMDYLVQILTRYRVESMRRRDPRRIWVGVFRHVAAPINTACLGAACAFLASALTAFRGAAELGIIAGGGLLLCLAAGYVILPALLTLFPMRRPRGLNPGPPARVLVTSKRRWRYVITPLLWCCLLVGGLPYASSARFNPDLLGLQSQDHESVQLVRHLQTWSAVVLSHDLAMLRKVQAALASSPLVDSTDSILDAYDNLGRLREWGKDVPSIDWSTPRDVRAGTLGSIAGKSRDLAKRLAKLDPAAAAALTTFADAVSVKSATDRDRIAARLTAWQTGFFDQLRDSLAAFKPTELNVDSLPPELRSHLVGADGAFALYIYPNVDLWEPINLGAFVRDVEKRIAAVPGAPAPTGIAINMHHSTSEIEQSFYRATAYALGAIVLLVLVDLRRVTLTLLAISVLAFGLPMLVILMGLLHVDWNFANFFALPILIGAGHEYGVFLVHRYLEARDGTRRPWGRWDVSDRALMLCAYVTCASFGFFWALASHRGLKSLGLVMTLGTACIYLASMLVLRPVLKWRLAGLAGRNRPAPSKTLAKALANLEP